MTDDLPKSPIKVDIMASAKLEVKTEVPADASGRAVHALSDAISPLTEWLGLMGDKVRIHRMQVVAKLIQRANEEITALGVDPHPIPTKIAVPLIEHASQERLDDEFMIDMWAKLLASATDKNSVPPRFISIISELDTRQARYFVDIAQGRPVFTQRRESRIDQRCYDATSKYPDRSFTRLSDDVRYVLHDEGVSYLGFLQSVRVVDRDEVHEPEETNDSGRAMEQLAADISIFESLGLIETVENIYKHLRDNVSYYAAVRYCGVTALGAQFLKRAMPSRKSTS